METVHIHTVIGSVFGNVTQYISNGELNAQQQELNINEPQRSACENGAEGKTVPATLQTPEARALMRKLTDAGILDGRWQPVGLSLAERGILTRYLSVRLDIKNQWRDFAELAELWDMNPETLRRAAAKALDQRKTLLFQDRLKSIFS